MRVDVKEDHKKQGFITVVPHGSIDTESHDSFRSIIGPLITDATKAITIDLKNVDYISSAGLGVFFAINEKMKNLNGKLLFCHLKPHIKKLFDIVKTLPAEHQFRTIEEADQFLYDFMNKEIAKKNKP